jgi:5-methylcytosine-specific restriction protein A
MPKRVPSFRPGGQLDRKAADRAYSKAHRQTDEQRFYNSGPWRRCARLKLQRNPACEVCWKAGLYTRASHVHHIVPLTQDWDRAFDLDNMQALCKSCHSRLHMNERRDNACTDKA